MEIENLEKVLGELFSRHHQVSEQCITIQDQLDELNTKKAYTKGVLTELTQQIQKTRADIELIKAKEKTEEKPQLKEVKKEK